MTRSKEKHFMRLAIKAATEGILKGQSPFGACLVKKSKVISISANKVWQNMDITAHAEICVIRHACKKLRTIDLSDCTIFSTCEPCPMCFSACHWARIERIVYGAHITDAGSFGFNELRITDRQMKKIGRIKIKITAGFMRRECIELFRKWREQGKSHAY